MANGIACHMLVFVFACLQFKCPCYGRTAHGYQEIHLAFKSTSWRLKKM